MSASLRERLIAALTLCPCCKATRMQERVPEDGIPDGYVHESVFICGSAVFVMDDDQLVVGRACPYPLDDKLVDIMRAAQQEFEGEDAQ